MGGGKPASFQAGSQTCKKRSGPLPSISCFPPRAALSGHGSCNPSLPILWSSSSSISPFVLRYYGSSTMAPGCTLLSSLSKASSWVGCFILIPVHISQAPEEGFIAQIFCDLRLFSLYFPLGRPVELHHRLPCGLFIKRFQISPVLWQKRLCPSGTCTGDGSCDSPTMCPSASIRFTRSGLVSR